MKFCLKIVLLSLILLPVISATRCNELDFEVENQTDQPVVIYLNGHDHSEVLPHQTKKGGSIYFLAGKKYFIEGINADGAIVYSRIFPRSEVIHDDFKITITPIETDPYLPLEVENRTRYGIEVRVNSVEDTYQLLPGMTIKKRPLPSNVDTYNIKAIAEKRVDDDIFYEIIFDKTFERSELESFTWKLVITESAS